ncbi:MAG: GNAT family N-acetyltransferase [Saprospiraceae bacterium]|nr:GNAT family N-acetyltransferase [Saprospiraceae bacterium]
MNLQPTLSNDSILAILLQEEHFEELYSVASDPLIWEQHPNPDRYKREVFRNYFDHAIISKGALLILDNIKKKIIGCSRYYDFNSDESSILIGYTFFAREYWGGNYNYATKYLMLNHAFGSVEKVFFHIGKNNIRSQKSIERIGAKKVRELDVAYAGEQVKTNYEYLIEKEIWNKSKI